MATTEKYQANWSDLLHRAVTEPGMIMQAYSNFHDYSIGNAVLIMVQCADRNLPVGPAASYKKWQELGRQVKSGEKGLVICRPFICKRKNEGDTEENSSVGYTKFGFVAGAFVLAQTDGADYEQPTFANGWDAKKAAENLGLTEIPFEHHDGNVQGYARGREFAVNPLAQLKIKTTAHESCHCLLHFTTGETFVSSDKVDKSEREMEAEATAMIVLDSLGLPGAEYARGYLQSWWGTSPIPEKNAQRIFTTADKILKAGKV